MHVTAREVHWLSCVQDWRHTPPTQVRLAPQGSLELQVGAQKCALTQV